MRHSSLTFGQVSVSQRQVSSPHDRICAFFKSRHPNKTAECVEAKTRGKVKAATVKKILERASLPSFGTYSVLVDVYGAEFIAATTDNPPQTIKDAAAIERDLRYQRRLADLRSEFDINP